ARARAAVVRVDTALSADVGSEHDGLPGLDAIGERARLDAIGNAVHQPAQQLPPEVLVRLVLEADRGVHLPLPRILTRERDRLAAAVALVGQHDAIAAAIVGGRKQHGGARLDGVDLVDRSQLWPLLPT